MGQRGHCGPTPRATSSNLGPSSSPPHPGFTITLLFQQKGGEGGRKAGVCLAALPPLPSAGPFPSRQETSPDSQPAAALPPPPPSTPGPRSHTPLRGPAAPLRFLRDGPQKAGLLPGAAPAHRPLLRVSGPRPSLPHAGPTRRCLCGTRQRPCLPGPLASESEKAWECGTWV